MKKFFFLFVALLMALPFLGQNSVLDSRLRNNLYLNVYTSKTVTKVGEPIVVTYKLYSSLESVSSIVKEPDFRGFEIRDLLGGGADEVSRETIDGVGFDVHTIKKVQLTPQETGQLELDPLVIRNRVQLIDAAGNRSALLNGMDDAGLTKGAIQFSISSIPITIQVNDLPANPRPSVVNGAAGQFKMQVHLSRVNYAQGEQGVLEITISGTGELDRVSAPEVQWPQDVVTGPVLTKKNYKDLGKNSTGSKIFRISFTATRPGSFTIMPIQFSYFDPKLNRYNTINNPPLSFYFRENKDRRIAITPLLSEDDNQTMALIFIGVGLLAVLLLCWLLVRMARNRKKTAPPLAPVRPTASLFSYHPNIDVQVLLQPAREAISSKGTVFFNALKQAMVQFFEKKYAIPAALFNKTVLKQTLTERQVSTAHQDAIFHVLTEIEMNIYSAGGQESDQRQLLDKVQKVLQQL